MILSFNTYTSEPTQRSRENGAIVVRPSEPFSAKCGHVMQLRPYQQDALERTLKCWRQYERLLGVAAVGAGKNNYRCACHQARAHEVRHFNAHRQELLDVTQAGGVAAPYLDALAAELAQRRDRKTLVSCLGRTFENALQRLRGRKDCPRSTSTGIPRIAKRSSSDFFAILRSIVRYAALGRLG